MGGSLRNLNELNYCRDVSPRIVACFGNTGDETCGAFNVRSITDAANLHIVASCDGGWDHVSVSRGNRCPNWQELEQIKRLFFLEGETAMQLHVPSARCINMHPYCLHLWRPQDCEIPRPPAWMVGISTPAGKLAAR